jgi:hypothetical protein
MYEMTTALWLGRNEALHGRCKEDEHRRLTALDIEITKFHSEAHLVLTDDRFYCEKSLARLLRGSSANKRRWLIRVKASRIRKAALHHQQPRITKFFPPQQDYRNQTTKTMPATASIITHRTKITQQGLNQTSIERIPKQQGSARNKTTQQLLTAFFQERAPNKHPNNGSPRSPPPSILDIG